MADKPPYKLVVKFDNASPDSIARALHELREFASTYDLTGESTATMMIESWREAPLRETMDAFEQWLYRFAPGLVKDQGMVLYRPGLRPETAELLARERRKTPMDQAGWEDMEAAADQRDRTLDEADEEALITPPPREPLALPAAGETGDTLEVDEAVYEVE